MLVRGPYDNKHQLRKLCIEARSQSEKNSGGTSITTFVMRKLVRIGEHLGHSPTDPFRKGSRVQTPLYLSLIS